MPTHLHRHSMVSYIHSARRHLPSTAARTAPIEIMAQIACYMDHPSLAAACLVSKHWLDSLFAFLWKCVPGSALYTPLFLHQLPLYHHLIERLDLSVSDNLEQQNAHISSKAPTSSVSVLDCRGLRVVSILHWLSTPISSLPSANAIIHLQCAARTLLMNNMQSLVQLDLYWLPTSSQDPIVTVIPQLKHLQHLSLSGWKSNNNNNNNNSRNSNQVASASGVLTNILQSCTKLRTLSLVENDTLVCKNAFRELRQLGLKTRIRTLALKKSTLGVEMFVNLTSCMPQLQYVSLQGSIWTKRPYVFYERDLKHLMASFRVQCPLLRSVDVSGSRCSDYNKIFIGPLHEALLTETIGTVEASNSYVFPSTFLSTLAHRSFSTLTRLNMGHPHQHWDPCLHAINYHRDYVVGVLEVLQSCAGLDFLDARGYPVDAQAIGAYPWAASRLRTLRICIEYETRVCHCTIGRRCIGGKTTPGTKEKTRVSDLLHNAYLQLGGLRLLQHLTLVRSEMSRQRERGGGHFELSLSAGLDKMAACKRMVVVGFEPVGLHSLQKEELRWFAKHWPVFETVHGYHRDELGRDMLSFR